PLPWRDLAFTERRGLRSIARGLLISRVQSFQKRHKRGCFRWAEVFSIGRHISSALDHLANQLIFGKSESNGVQRRSALSPFVIQRMTLMTLLGLNNQRTFPCQGRTSVHCF